MTRAIRVTPTEVRAARLELQALESAGLRPDPLVRKLANAKVMRRQDIEDLEGTGQPPEWPLTHSQMSRLDERLHGKLLVAHDAFNRYMAEDRRGDARRLAALVQYVFNNQHASPADTDPMLRLIEMQSLKFDDPLKTRQQYTVDPSFFDEMEQRRRGA